MSELSDMLKKTVRDSKFSMNVISTKIGVSASTLSRFMSGETSPFDLADKLTSFLGLELVKKG